MLTARVSPAESFRPFEAVPSSPLRVKRGRCLFHAGDKFSAIYSVRFGSFKTFTGDHEGRQQVTGFALAGDFLGFDGIGGDGYNLTAVALEDSEVLVLPFASLERAARDHVDLQHYLHVLMSREIVHDQGVMMLLGSLRAGARLAAFLLTLSRRFQRLGYSAADFNLRMTRADIASYLGLKIETVSRTLSLFAADGLIEVHDKHIRLVDLEGLDRTWKGDTEGTDTVIERAAMVRADARNTRQSTATAVALSRSMRDQRLS